MTQELSIFPGYSIPGAHWLDSACGDCQGADVNCDGIVDLEDMENLAIYWLWGK